MHPAIAFACGTVSFTGCKVAAVVVVYAERLPGYCAGAFTQIALKDFFPDTGPAADFHSVLHEFTALIVWPIRMAICGTMALPNPLILSTLPGIPLATRPTGGSTFQ